MSVPIVQADKCMQLWLVGECDHVVGGIHLPCYSARRRRKIDVHHDSGARVKAWRRARVTRFPRAVGGGLEILEGVAATLDERLARIHGERRRRATDEVAHATWLVDAVDVQRERLSTSDRWCEERSALCSLTAVGVTPQQTWLVAHG